MQKIFLSLIFIFCLVSFCFAEGKNLLLDDFEGDITGGPQGTVDFGAGGGSVLDVSGSGDIKFSGKQSLKTVYDAVPDGYMWIAKGFGLDAENAGWLIKPEEINWKDYNGFSFYIYGSGSKAKIAFDIKDSGSEMWRYMLEDDFSGWKQVICPFSGFIARDDWQPDNADKNAVLDFPIKSFQFEPRPEAKGVLYFDDVELIKPEV